MYAIAILIYLCILLTFNFCIILSIKATLLRLGVLKLKTSHSYMYKKLDAFGLNSNGKVLQRVEDECKRLGKIWMVENPAVVSDTTDLHSSPTPHGKFKTTITAVGDTGDKDETVERLNEVFRKIKERESENVAKAKKVEIGKEIDDPEQGTYHIFFI